MEGGRRLCVAGVVVLALGGIARADIVNGGFSSGLSGWQSQVSPLNDESLALVEVVNDQVFGARLHVVTANTYNWDEGKSQWLLQETDFSAAVATQNVPADANDFYAPPGTTALEFDADIEILGAPAGNSGAGVLVGVNYNETRLNEVAGDGLLRDGAARVWIDMPGLVANQPGIDFYIVGTSQLDVTPNPDDEASYTITVNAYFDNFTFVPEPVSASLLLLGGAMLTVRRRRNGFPGC